MQRSRSRTCFRLYVIVLSIQVSQYVAYFMQFCDVLGPVLFGTFGGILRKGIEP